MPSELLVDADGYTLTDEQGYELDQSCIEQCCAPGGECPTPCGREWRMCVRKWKATRTRRVRIVHPQLGVVEDSTLIVVHEMRLDAGDTHAPWRLDPVDPDSDGIDGPCQFVVSGLVPTTRVLEETNGRDPACLGPFAPFREEQRACELLVGYCTSPESEGTDPPTGSEPTIDVPANVRSPLVLPLSAVGFGGAFARAGVIVGQGCEITPATEIPWGTSVRTVRCVLGTPGNPLAACVSTANIFNGVSWRYAKSGVSFYRQRYSATQTGQAPVDCGNGTGGVIGCGTLTASDEIEVEAEWEHSTLVENDGTAREGCVGSVPAECVGERLWVEGRSCGREGRGRVFLPFENVRVCGVIGAGPPLDATGRLACYEFRKTEGLFTALPGGAWVGTGIVDERSPRTCCVCGAQSGRCQATDLRALVGADGELKPNWVSWRRNAGGVLERVGGINVAGTCCCALSDLITVNFVESELTAFGQSLIYVLRPGRGLGVTFRRDTLWPVGDPTQGGGDPSYGQFVSDVRELLPGGGVGAVVGQQFWGQARNEPPMVCEWTELMTAGYFDFNRPHDCVGTWNNAQGQQFGRLAAPGDSDRDEYVNGFRLMDWEVRGITCETFDFQCRYAHQGGGGVLNRMRLSIARPAVAGDPCAGGCVESAGGGAGGSGLALGPRPSALSSGCGGCGSEDEGRL